MKIDTKQIEHDFCTFEIDGFILINPREIGITIANELMDSDIIWQSDIYNKVEEYLIDIFLEAQTIACEVLKENNKKIDY